MERVGNGDGSLSRKPHRRCEFSHKVAVVEARYSARSVIAVVPWSLSSAVAAGVMSMKAKFLLGAGRDAVSDDSTARIWHAATGNEIKVLRGHEHSVNSAATPIVTASWDKTARIWDAHFASMSTKGLLVETCKHRLAGLSKLSRDDMRLLGYLDDVPEIDVCEGVQ
jgi:WD40 repeat protein